MKSLSVLRHSTHSPASRFLAFPTLCFLRFPAQPVEDDSASEDDYTTGGLFSAAAAEPQSPYLAPHQLYSTPGPGSGPGYGGGYGGGYPAGPASSSSSAAAASAAALLGAAARPELQGWLWKRDPRGPDWRRRWFQLIEGRLHYAKAPDGAPLGAIQLSRALAAEMPNLPTTVTLPLPQPQQASSVNPANPASSSSSGAGAGVGVPAPALAPPTARTAAEGFPLRIDVGSRVYMLRAPTDAERRAWVEAIVPLSRAHAETARFLDAAAAVAAAERERALAAAARARPLLALSAALLHATPGLVHLARFAARARARARGLAGAAVAGAAGLAGAVNGSSGPGRAEPGPLDAAAAETADGQVR